MQMFAFQGVVALNGFDLSEQVSMGQKLKGFWGGLGVGGWSRGCPSKSSDVGFLKDRSAPPLWLRYNVCLSRNDYLLPEPTSCIGQNQW